MVFNKRVKLILGGTLGALVLAGGVYAGTAFAQSGSPSPSGTPANTFLQHLAQRLNISQDQAQTALKGAAHDSVADAVAAGRLTQDQANRINQRIDSGPGPGGFGFGFAPKPGGPGGPGPRGGFAPGQVLNAAAQALNMQPSDLMSQLRSGKTLADIAKAQNVELSTVTTAITNVVKPRLDQAVASGRLTQQQENDILGRISSGQFPGPGRFGVRPGHSGRPAGAPASSSPQPAPSASS